MLHGIHIHTDTILGSGKNDLAKKILLPGRKIHSIKIN